MTDNIKKIGIFKKTSRKVGGKYGQNAIHQWDGNSRYVIIEKLRDSDGNIIFWVILRRFNSISRRWGNRNLLEKTKTETKALDFAVQYMKANPNG